MNRREFLAGASAISLALMVPLPSAGSSHKEYTMPSLMAVLLDMTDDQFHAIDPDKRHLMMAALYEVWNDDPDVVELLVGAVTEQSPPLLRELHDRLKTQAQRWYQAVNCAP
jgi:putative SOS response-associated peptidase YedK